MNFCWDNPEEILFSKEMLEILSIGHVSPWQSEKETEGVDTYSFWWNEGVMTSCIH